MKTVFAAGTHFDAVELYGAVGVQVEIEALEKEGGVHAIGGYDNAGDRGVDPVLEAENPSGTADILDSAGGAVDGVRVGRILEVEQEGGAARCAYRHLFRYAAVCCGIGICDTG